VANAPFERFVVVEFACRHRREFSVKSNVPPLGEHMICLRCRRETTVIKHLEEYRVRCSDCLYSRPFGANRLQAEIAASKHHNRYPYHEVTMWKGTHKAHTWERNQQQLFAKSLPRKPVDTLDLPPF
jgi:transcription elongation factor Elf1